MPNDDPFARHSKIDTFDQGGSGGHHTRETRGEVRDPRISKDDQSTSSARKTAGGGDPRINGDPRQRGNARLKEGGEHSRSGRNAGQLSRGTSFSNIDTQLNAGTGGDPRLAKESSESALPTLTREASSSSNLPNLSRQGVTSVLQGPSEATVPEGADDSAQKEASAAPEPFTAAELWALDPAPLPILPPNFACFPKEWEGIVKYKTYRIAVNLHLVYPGKDGPFVKTFFEKLQTCNATIGGTSELTICARIKSKDLFEKFKQGNWERESTSCPLSTWRRRQ